MDLACVAFFFYSKCWRPDGGRLTLDARAGCTSTNIRNKKTAGGGVGFLYGQMDLQRGIMEFAGLKCGPEVNASGYCALPAAHPRLTWLCVTYTSSDNYSHHYISGSAYAICQIAFFFFFPCVQFIYYIHFICGWVVSVEPQYLLSCFNLPNVMP